MNQPGIPGSSSEPHPTDGIPLPPHGFERLDSMSVGGPAEIPAVEVITQAAALLMSAATQQLGMAPDGGEPSLDLQQARALITALAGLLAASREYLGADAGPLLDGVKTLQAAFREAAAYPDEPGQGPGEALLG